MINKPGTCGSWTESGTYLPCMLLLAMCVSQPNQSSVKTQHQSEILSDEVFPVFVTEQNTSDWSLIVWATINTEFLLRFVFRLSYILLISSLPAQV